MKNIIVLLSFLICAISYIDAQETMNDSMFDFNSKTEIRKKEKLNDSPYAIFGDNTTVLKTDHERNLDHSLKIPLLGDDNQAGLLELNFQTGVVIIKDMDRKVISEQTLSLDEISRFISIDPKAEKYYSISPYVYCANNPLKYTDPNGDTIRISIYDAATQTINSYYYGAGANGGYGFIGADGNIYSGNDAFAGSLTTALGKLREKGAGRALVDDLANSTNTVTISNSNKNSAYTKSNEVGWNDTNENPYASRPGFVGLGHEMGHMQAAWNNTTFPGTMPTIEGDKIDDSEIYTTHMENQIRAEHGIPLRTHYAYDKNSGNGINSTRVINAATSTSLFYTQQQTHSTTRIVNGSPVITNTIVNVPFRYRGY